MLHDKYVGMLLPPSGNTMHLAASTECPKFSRIGVAYPVPTFVHSKALRYYEAFLLLMHYFGHWDFNLEN